MVSGFSVPRTEDREQKTDGKSEFIALMTESYSECADESSDI